MRPVGYIEDQRLMKALAHPLRVRILTILEDRIASPSEIAEEIETPLGNVAYHVRILARLGLIEVVRRTPRRGAIESHYQAVARVTISDDAWASVPRFVKDALVDATLQQIGRYVATGAAAGGFERPEAQLARQPLALDEQGWKELASAVTALLDRAVEIEKESGARLVGRDHEGELRAGLVLMLFEQGAGVPAAPEAAAAFEASGAASPGA